MSRQYDEAMEGHFDLNGTEYVLVEPSNMDELVQAFEVKSALETYISGFMHDEDPSGYENLLQEQNDYIREYADSLGEFDSTILSNNITFLTKKNGLKVGELESMLDISAGYISRTIKENSKKKMSIDTVWKIARLFDTDVKTLTETQMSVIYTNTELLEKFIHRLYIDTRDEYFGWESDGGVEMELNDRYKQMKLVTEDAENNAVYHPDHLNPSRKWLLSKDIVCLECFDHIKDLVIIPYKMENDETFNGYDFIFVWSENGAWHWEKIFYTSDDFQDSLKEKANDLYEMIEKTEFDIKLSPKLQQMITDYVTGGRPE
jgi:transcriptional regulator with XRE-family HTH domain